MPWTARSAKKYTNKAKTPKQQRQWAHVSNDVLDRTGSEKRAIMAANAVVGRSGRKKNGRSSRRSARRSTRR